MKKLLGITVLIIGVLIISISSFNKVEEAFSLYDIEIQTDVNLITKESKYLKTEIKIPVVKLENTAIKERINKKIESDIMKFYDEFSKQAEDYFDEYSDEVNKFYLNTDFEVKTNRGQIYSVLVKVYTFSGGAHGNYEYVPYNVDVLEGEFIELKDFFKAGTDYESLINQEIKLQIARLNSQKKLPEDSKQLYSFERISEKQKFYLEGKNLVIIFDLYEIAPYVAGIPEFYVDLEKIKSSINKNYIYLVN